LNIYFERPFNLTAKDLEIDWRFISDSLVEVTYFRVSKSPVWLQIQEIGVPNVTYVMAYFELYPRLGMATGSPHVCPKVVSVLNHTIRR